MAPKKRRTGGRTTAPGTQSHHTRTPEATTRYTPPVPVTVKESPRWVPILMFVLLGLGALVILFYYLGFVPGGRNNWYLFSGLMMVLGGLFTATKYR
jgi:hypothetical protein